MRKHQNEISVGIFVVVGFILLALVVFFISGVYIFRSGYNLSVMYDYVSILDKGAPVRMAGVRIGEVSKVDLVHDEADGRVRVRVKLFIEKGVQIRENYLFQIHGTHILSEPHIEITPRAGSSPFLRGGELIEGHDPVPVEELINRAHEVADNLARIVASLRNALEDKKTTEALHQIILNLASLTQSLETVTQGSEGDLKGAIANLRSSTDSLDRILSRIDKGEGTAGRLLKEEEIYKDLRALVADVRKHPWKLLHKDKKFLFF